MIVAALLSAAAFSLPHPAVVCRVGTAAFRAPEDVRLLAASADGRRVYSVGAYTPPTHAVIHVWDADTGRLLARRPYAQPGEHVQSLFLAADGLWAWVTREDGALFSRRIDPDTGRTLATTPPHREPPPKADAAKPNIQYQPNCGPGGWLCQRVGNAHRLIDTNTGRSFDLGPTADYTQSVFRPDGKVFVVIAPDGAARLYDLPSGKLAATLPKSAGPETWAQFTPDGRSLAVWVKRPDGFALELWDAAGGRRTVLDKQKHAGTLEFSPDGTAFARRTNDALGSAGWPIWEVRALADGRLLRSFPEFDRHRDVVLGPQGKTLYRMDGERTIVPWDVATGRPRAGVDPPGAIQRFRFTPAGNLAALVGDSVLTFDATTGRELSRARLPQLPDYWYGVQFTAAGDRLRYVGPDSRLTTWDFRTGKQTVRFLPIVPPKLPSGFPASPGLVFTADGGFLVGGTNTLRVRNAATGASFSRRFPAGWKSEWYPGQHAVGARAVTADGRRVAVAGHPTLIVPDGRRTTVAVFETASPRRSVARSLGDVYVEALAYSPDGRFLAVGGGGGGESWVRVLDGRTLRDAATVPGLDLSLAPNALVFSPDGRTLAVSGGVHEVRLVDAATWEVKAVLPSPRLEEKIAVLGYHRDAVVFSADGRRLATATPDGRVLVWDVRKLPAK